jgi:hypothetical protein
MIRRVFLIVGVTLMGAGLLVSQTDMNVSVQGRRADAETSRIVRYAVGGGLAGLGAIFTLVGLVGMVRGSRQAKRNQYLLQHGVDAEGTVTFVDRNYSILVNRRPIYSIIEYTYRDAAGNQHTRRITNADSDLVIRKQIHVGAKVAVKYSADNPGESLIVLT